MDSVFLHKLVRASHHKVPVAKPNQHFFYNFILKHHYHVHRYGTTTYYGHIKNFNNYHRYTEFAIKRHKHYFTMYDDGQFLPALIHRFHPPFPILHTHRLRMWRTNPSSGYLYTFFPAHHTTLKYIRKPVHSVLSYYVPLYLEQLIRCHFILIYDCLKFNGVI